MSKEIILSPQQAALPEFVLNPNKRNALVKAVAGSGKTFILMETLPLLEGQVAFCAYSAPIKDELQKKYDQKSKSTSFKAAITIGTVHSFGRKSVIAAFPDTKLLTKDDPQEKIDLLMEATNVPYYLKKFVRKAYNLARQWGVGLSDEFRFRDVDKWYDLVEHFNLEDEFANTNGELPHDSDKMVREGCTCAARLIKLGVQMADKYIDFEDMLYVPLYLGLKVWQYDWVLVDECQDLNITRRMYVKMMLRPGGRAIFVGDPHQAIFGFTGADSKSFENIKHEFDCEELPLTWSFRCPKAIIEYAHQWVDHIQAHPDAPNGTFMEIDEVALVALPLTPDDAILCRNNAPLVDLFFQFLGKGVACHIEGKDISRDLITLIDRWKAVKRVPTLLDKMEEYVQKKVAKQMAAAKEEKAARLMDTFEAIKAIAANINSSSVFDLKTRIYGMFQDAKGEKVKTLTLTSIHKSKGREWEHVYWFGKNRWNPSSYARQDWQMEQEDNLCYVAATRSKDTLVIVHVTVPERKR